MKRNLKTLLILLAVFVSFSAFSSKTKALAKGDEFVINDFGKYAVGTLGYSGITYSDNVYSGTGNGSTVAAYCEDPGDKGPNGRTYNVERVLGTGSSKIVQAYDYGLLEILKKGKNTYNDSYTFTSEGGTTKTITGNDLYTATSIATRTYTIGLFGWGHNPSSAATIKKHSSYTTRALQWASYHADKVNALFSTNCTTDNFTTCFLNNYLKSSKKSDNASNTFSWYKSNVNFNTNGDVGTDILYAAQSLFVEGLNKAYEVKTNSAKTASVTAVAAAEASDKNVNGDIIEEYYYQTISFENFDEKTGKIYDFALTCQNCAKNNITLGSLEIYNQDTKKYSEYRAGNNAIRDFKGSNGKVSGTLKLRFKVTRKNNDENCSTVKYNIAYKLYDPSLKSNEEYIGAKISTGGTNWQRFFIIQKNTDNNENNGISESNIEGSIKCAVVCDTELELPVCSTNEDDSVATVKTSTKIKACIIDNEDEAGNSYQFTNSSGGVDNSYCKVYCKEDYAEIKLNPIVQNVKCGGYFKLTSKVAGTKTCYTGGNTDDKSINKEQFIKDVIAAQTNIIDKYNEYYKWEQSLNYIESTSSKYHSKKEGRSCHTNEDGSRSCHTTCRNAGSCDGYDVDMSTSDNVYGYSINCNETTGICSFSRDESLSNSYSKDGGSDGRCYTGSCSSGSKSTLESNIKSEMSKAKDALNKAIKAYQKILEDYNACSTAWTNNFAFAQKIKYYYDENQGGSQNYTPYYDLLEDNDELTYLVADGDASSKGTITICTGDTDFEYNCINGSELTYDLDIDKDAKLSKYNYNTSYKDLFEHMNFVICDTDGCKIDDKSYVSKAKFVKKEVSKEQKYITPTAFYQIQANGKVVAYDDYDFDKINLEELTNKLPVSTNSVGGGVFKLMIEGLGEFYGEKNAYGRLFDFGQNNESRSVANAKLTSTTTINDDDDESEEKTNGSFNGEYICYYENKCRPNDCPTCEFTCEGESCKWTDCPDCNVTCENCIFNYDELNISAKTITTTNVKAANRTYGYNWITSSNMAVLSLLNKKAAETITEIEEVNEMVYDDKTTDGSTLGFSIKLTPEIIDKITKYNKDNEEKGGYINNSLTCYDDTIDGVTYKNIYCYSELIDKLVEENGDNVTVLSTRINDEEKRASGSSTSGYWTLWKTFATDKTSESVIGGPSWK